MLRLNAVLRRFGRDRRGTTAIEYGLICALVAIGFLAGLKALGDGNSAQLGGHLQQDHRRHEEQRAMSSAASRKGRRLVAGRYCSIVPSASASRILGACRAAGASAGSRAAPRRSA